MTNWTIGDRLSQTLRSRAGERTREVVAVARNAAYPETLVALPDNLSQGIWVDDVDLRPIN